MRIATPLRGVAILFGWLAYVSAGGDRPFDIPAITQGGYMNGVLKSAIIILIASGIATVWGYQYRQSHAVEGAMGMFFGGVSQTYVIAGWALGLGILGFLIGIGVLVAGLLKAGNGPK
ncbi:MAG: hypothetical protein HY313_00250 [Acidobacteria bacterium]|nr:hypothetical protein [Acidobacteriota bacterium]